MHLHILGIGGTFMAGVAMLARALGHRVTGCDARIYPPMSTQLADQGIGVHEGYDPAPLDPAPDLVIIGNALARANAAVEAVLDRGLPYTSGAQWVAENALAGRWVLAVAGTHGKTTTASLLAWILEHAGLRPGFLIGGVPENFGVSARLGDAPFFVIEADEYDTAFFDKRSKFVHYRPRTAVLNNLEYDHADIFPDLEAVRRQFHHFVRTVPGSGLLVVNGADRHLAELLAMGCWTPVETFVDDVQGRTSAAEGRMPGAADPGPTAAAWRAEPLNAEASRFRVHLDGQALGEVAWGMIGRHNMLNALAAIAAARHAGVPPPVALAALPGFRPVKRRLEVRGAVNGITVYDDFAHHPTAIRATLEALRARVGRERIVAVLEPRSNTMKLGVHRADLAPALAPADQVLLYRPADLAWDLETVTRALNGDVPGAVKAQSFDSVEALIAALCARLHGRDHVLIMSNGGFENIHARLLERLRG